MQLERFVRSLLDKSPHVAGKGQGACVVWCEIDRGARQLLGATGGLGDIIRPALAESEQVPLGKPRENAGIVRIEAEGTLQILAGGLEAGSIESEEVRNRSVQQVMRAGTAVEQR